MDLNRILVSLSSKKGKANLLHNLEVGFVALVDILRLFEDKMHEEIIDDRQVLNFSRKNLWSRIIDTQVRRFARTSYLKVHAAQNNLISRPISHYSALLVYMRKDQCNM